MPISRRTFVRQVVTVGPVAMAFWMERDVAWAADCAMPDVSQECTLPTPATPVRFTPNEPKVVPRYSTIELNHPSKATQLKQLRDGVCLIRDLPPTDILSWTKLIAQHCIHCARSNADNIHYNRQFLPWHRGLLYFVERAMRKLGKMDDMRLAYWNWESKDSRTVPAIYAPSGQPLYWANRHLTTLTDDQVNVQPLLALPTFDIFGGTATQRSPVPASFSGPHADVHNAFAPGDMADLQYSPRDPVFYAHHGNIDRLWSSWVAAGHTNPDFGDAKVYFYDENRVWSYMLFNDLRDETKLGYRYSSLMTPKVKVSGLRAESLGKTGNQVTFGAKLRTKLKLHGPKFLILQNINVEKLSADARNFGIFSSQPAVGTANAQAKGFIGRVGRVLSSGHQLDGPISAALEVPSLSGLAEEGKGALKLFVAPLDAAGKTTAASIPLDATDVSFVG